MATITLKELIDSLLKLEAEVGPNTPVYKFESSGCITPVRGTSVISDPEYFPKLYEPDKVVVVIK